MAISNLTKFVAPISILLSGCAHQIVWDKPGATEINFSQDNYQCAQETASSGSYAAIGAPLFVAAAAAGAQRRQQAMYKLCMQAHGWVAQK